MFFSHVNVVSSKTAASPLLSSFIYQFIYLSIYLSLYIVLSIYLRIHSIISYHLLSTHHPSIHPSIHLSTRPSSHHPIIIYDAVNVNARALLLTRCGLVDGGNGVGNDERREGGKISVKLGW